MSVVVRIKSLILLLVVVVLGLIKLLELLVSAFHLSGSFNVFGLTFAAVELRV